MSMYVRVCIYWCIYVHIYTQRHTCTYTDRNTSHQKGMKSHSLQELRETFRGSYAKWNTSDQLFPCRTYQTIHHEQKRTKQKQAHSYHKGTHGWCPEEGAGNWWWGWSWGENEWVPLVRETDKAMQPSTYEIKESQVRHDTKRHLPWYQVVTDSH